MTKLLRTEAAQLILGGLDYLTTHAAHENQWFSAANIYAQAGKLFGWQQVRRPLTEDSVPVLLEPYIEGDIVRVAEFYVNYPKRPRFGYRTNQEYATTIASELRTIGLP